MSDAIRSGPCNRWETDPKNTTPVSNASGFKASHSWTPARLARNQQLKAVDRRT